MDDLSNKALAGLLVVAIVVSLAGTVVSLDKLGRLRLGLFATGLAVNTPVTAGTASVTIEQEATANLSDATVTFDQGVVVAASPYAYLDTNGNNTNWNGSATQDAMEVVNDGNVNLNITVKASKNSTAFICEGENFLIDCGRNTTQKFVPNFSFWADLNESNGSLGDPDSCGGASFQGTGSFFKGGNRTNPREFTNSTNEYVACENLSPSAGIDRFVIEFAINIPDDAQGTKNNTITITARSTA